MVRRESRGEVDNGSEKTLDRGEGTYGRKNVAKT
jgi:hypothetical protein